MHGFTRWTNNDVDDGEQVLQRQKKQRKELLHMDVSFSSHPPLTENIQKKQYSSKPYEYSAGKMPSRTRQSASARRSSPVIPFEISIQQFPSPSRSPPVIPFEIHSQISKPQNHPISHPLCVAISEMNEQVRKESQKVPWIKTKKNTDEELIDIDSELSSLLETEIEEDTSEPTSTHFIASKHISEGETNTSEDTSTNTQPIINVSEDENESSSYNQSLISAPSIQSNYQAATQPKQNLKQRKHEHRQEVQDQETFREDVEIWSSQAADIFPPNHYAWRETASSSSSQSRSEKTTTRRDVLESSARVDMMEERDTVSSVRDPGFYAPPDLWIEGGSGLFF